MKLGPNSQDEASIYSYMAQCLKEQEKYHEALNFLEKGMKSDDERTDILNLMGFCQFKLKRHEKAIESFEKLIKLDPSSAIDYEISAPIIENLETRTMPYATIKRLLKLIHQ